MGKIFSVLNEDVAEFYATLTKGLDALEGVLATEGLSFSFVGMGIDLLRSTHSGVLLLVEKLQLPLSAKGEEWVNEYMNETVKLLDVCNVLKVGVSGFERYQMLVDLVVGALQDQDHVRHFRRGLRTLNLCSMEMMRMQNEHKNLMDVKIEAEGKLSISNLGDKHIENKFVKWNGFWGALFAMRMTSSYICRLLLSAIVYAGPIPSLNLEVASVGSPWSCSLVRLHQRVSEEISKTRDVRCNTMLSKELEILENTLGELRSRCTVISDRRGPMNSEEAAEMKQRAATLKGASQKFQTGLEVVEWHVNDLFDEIVEGRNKVLSIVSSSSR